MSIETVRDVFTKEVATFGDALTGIYARGGLMSHHDGVNDAVEAFWSAAEEALASGLSNEEIRELEGIYNQILNLTFNAYTGPEKIVGSARYEYLINAL